MQTPPRLVRGAGAVPLAAFSLLVPRFCPPEDSDVQLSHSAHTPESAPVIRVVGILNSIESFNLFQASRMVNVMIASSGTS